MIFQLHKKPQSQFERWISLPFIPMCLFKDDDVKETTRLTLELENKLICYLAKIKVLFFCPPSLNLSQDFGLNLL